MELDNTVVIPLLMLIGAVVLDWIAGILVALKVSTFTWSLVPRQLESTVLPIVGPTSIAALIQGLLNAQHSAVTPAFTVIVIAFATSYAPKFLADASDKYATYTEGLPQVPKA